MMSGAARGQGRFGRAWAVVSRHPWIGPLAALVVVYLLFTILSSETFARPANLVTMIRQTTVVGLAAVGMTIIILSGGIDLSVGSVVALTTVVIAQVLRSGSGPVLAALSGVAVASCAGLANGLLITGLKITPFIVTLGAMSVLRGAAKGFAREQKIDADPRGLDALILPAESGWTLLPAGVWLLVLVALLAVVVLRWTRFGRHVRAIGSNEQTARLCGLDVRRVKVAVYTLAGALAGLSGVIEFGTLTVGDPTDSVGLELEVIASVVIGGGSLSGGSGSILGSLIGAFLMTVIKTGCTHVGMPNWVQEVVTGGIIVAAVALDRLRTGGREPG
jgi:ribose/xylose/arabinose/galactoside ABC-type transport system permease subunit